MAFGVLLIAYRDKDLQTTHIGCHGSADKAKTAWAGRNRTSYFSETEQTGWIPLKDSVSTLYESYNTSYQENDNKSSSMGENHQSSEETEE